MLCITCSRLDRGVTVKLHVLNSMFVSKELGWTSLKRDGLSCVMRTKSKTFLVNSQSVSISNHCYRFTNIS